MAVADVQFTVSRFMHPLNQLPPTVVTDPTSMLVRPVQFKKACELIVITVDGKTTLVSPVQPSNALDFMVLSFGRSNPVRLLRFTNADSSIDVMLLPVIVLSDVQPVSLFASSEVTPPRSIVLRPVQFLNAYILIDVTVLGRVKSTRLVHPSKALVLTLASFGKATVVKLVQPINPLAASVVTRFAVMSTSPVQFKKHSEYICVAPFIVTVEIDVHPSNALALTVFVVVLRVTSVSDLQPLNDSTPMVVKVLGNVKPINDEQLRNA